MPANKSADEALQSIQPGLNLYLDGARIETGDFVPKAKAQNTPVLAYAGTPGKTYIVVALDMDAPFPMLPVLGPILHWIQPDYTTSAADVSKLETTAPFVADYIGPAPPPGSGPHRYAFFLYEQPETFDAKKFAPPNGQKYALTKRMFTSLDKFEKDAGLGKIVATTYFKSN